MDSSGRARVARTFAPGLSTAGVTPLVIASPVVAASAIEMRSNLNGVEKRAMRLPSLYRAARGREVVRVGYTITRALQIHPADSVSCRRL